MKKLPYKEGDVFAVPLRNGDFALGIVARSPRLGKVLLGYFFSYNGPIPPTANSVPDLKAESAVLAVRFGDLSLYQKEWPVVGHVPNWDRRNWPMPSFVRRDPLSSRALRISYSDDDPSKQVSKEPLSDSEATLQSDGLLGAGAVEIALTQILAPQWTAS